MSKMQTLINTAKRNVQLGYHMRAFDSLIQAIELLSKAQHQIMSDMDKLERNRTDMQIKGE